MKTAHSLAACVLAFASPAFAELPVGEKKITLSSATEKIEIGTVAFVVAGPNRKISVKLNDGLFKGYFLSMRPFKCMEGTTRYYCHLPYPYEWRGEISPADLADLEYALLFVQKAPSAYGINLWNGIYYKLRQEGSTFTGTLHEVDMDNLASPPAKGNFRPLTEDMLTPTAGDGQWLPTLTIE
jgi:hypothetical protein